MNVGMKKRLGPLSFRRIYTLSTRPPSHEDGCFSLTPGARSVRSIVHSREILPYSSPDPYALPSFRVIGIDV